MRPDDPSQYTVEFLPDGTLAIQADCNHATGAYTVAGAQIDLQIGGVTRMACPPGSLMDPFLADLDQVVSYTIQQTLSLAVDGGGVMHSPRWSAPRPRKHHRQVEPRRSPVGVAPGLRALLPSACRL